MLQIFESSGDLLAPHDRFEAGKREAIDDLWRIGQLINVDMPERPTYTDRDGSVEKADNVNVMFDEGHYLSKTAGPLPGHPSTDHIEIVGSVNDSPNDQRSAPKHGALTVWKVQRPQGVE